MQTTTHARESILSAVIRGVIWGLALSVIFAAGFLARGFLPASMTGPLTRFQAKSEVGEYPLLTQVQVLLNDNYLRTQPSQTELEFFAAQGLVAGLNDKYSFMIAPPVAQSESNVLAGIYGGIGVQVARDDKGNYVLFPFKGGPAARAGVQDGDVLLKVNGADVAPDAKQDAVDQALRGEVKNDNGVEILVKRPATNEELTFKIVFEQIEVPSIVYRVLAEDAKIGFIQIMRFTNRTPQEVKDAVSDLKSQNIKAMVLDLRNNPGGLLQESITVAGEFIDGGIIVYERSRNGEKNYEVAKGGSAVDLPLVVLVNKDTASAAELVAGAIQDRGRGILIGQKTFGKGSVQLIFPLLDKSALHVTAAEWLSPNKVPLDGLGIEPKISMIPDPNGRDVEIGEAIRQLHEQMK